MKEQPKPFNIRVTMDITFKDWNGTVLKHYPVGTILTATAKTAHYYVTSMGGIFFDEAEEIV